jgi:tRNA(adenine34) deaminase
MNDQADQQFMEQALKLARQAAELGEVPVGAVVVRHNKVVGRGWNQPIRSNNPCAHAEIIALQAAATALDNYRLSGCQLYVTLEPCTMCVGAMIHARIERLVYGAQEPKAGAVVSRLQLLQAGHFNHHIAVRGDLLAACSSRLLKHFFAQKRRQRSSLHQHAEDSHDLNILT